MKKITDERLVLRNLQHIRIVYIVQTLGILAILGYELYVGGLDGMRENPLWLLFMATAVVYAYLSMSTSVEHERRVNNPKKWMYVGLSIIAVIACIVAFLVSITPGFGWGTGFLVAGVIAVCSVIPVVYVYRLRMAQLTDLEDE